MIETLLRDADPARELTADPTSPPARAMLADIVSQPRMATRGPSRRVRRVVVGGVLAGAAATVALAAPMPWDHGGPDLGSSAYAVTTESDGTVKITIRWSELSDVATLQAELDRAHAHVKILTGTVEPNTGTPPSIPACAFPYTGRPYSERAVTWDFPNAASEVNGIIVRPKYFPKDGTFVIEAFRDPGSTTLRQSLSFMAVGAVPTCAVPMVSAPVSPLPTR